MTQMQGGGTCSTISTNLYIHKSLIAGIPNAFALLLCLVKLVYDSNVILCIDKIIHVHNISSNHSGQNLKLPMAEEKPVYSFI